MSASDRLSYHLIAPRLRDRACEAIRIAPNGYIAVIRPAGRSLNQNARLHAMLTEIARSGFEWGGCRRTVDELKVLFVSAHAVATKHHAELVEGLEGETVMLRESTAAMSKERVGSLMDYMEAWCAQHGIELQEPRP